MPDFGRKARVLKSVAADVAIAARFGASLADKWRLASALVDWHHAGRIPLLRDPGNWDRPLRLRAFGRPFDLWITPGRNDMLVFHEIFGEGVYELPLGFEPRVIVDLGAFTGMSALFFALRYPQASIYCVEPDPDNFALLTKHTSALPHVTRIDAAIGGTAGERTFYKSATQNCGHSLYASADSATALTVRCTTVNDLVSRFALPAIDILKFDVEGAETEVFESFPFSVPVRAMVGELHLPEADERVFASRVRDRGYDVELIRDPYLGLTMFRAFLRDRQHAAA